MKNKIIMVFVLVAILTFSAIGFAQPEPPSGPPTAGSDTQPLKERLEAFYDAKEDFMNQKRQCKEFAAATNAAKGTCWDRLKPMMINILLQQIALTDKRMAQLQEKGVAIPDIDAIKAKIAEAKAVFEDSGASKEAIKSSATDMETIINQIEETALQGHADVLIKQMDNLMEKADAITSRLEERLSAMKAAGQDVTDLESSFEQYKADLAQTKQNIASAKAKYAQMESSDEISQLAKEVRALIDNAQNSLVKGFDKAKALAPRMSGPQGGDPQGGDPQDGDPQGGESQDGEPKEGTE